jgi:hypothetical protein
MDTSTAGQTFNLDRTSRLPPVHAVWFVAGRDAIDHGLPETAHREAT